MPNRRYMGKETGEHEFIYVDLLPNVKRPRQFNVNILYIVLIAVAASWFLVYMPLANRQETLDRVLEQSNDMQNQLLLLNEEIVGHRIDEDRINFANQLEHAMSLESDFQSKFEILNNQVESFNGEIISVRYDAVTEEYLISVALINEFLYQNLNLEILELDFVNYSAHTAPLTIAGSVRYRATYTIGVDLNAE